MKIFFVLFLTCLGLFGLSNGQGAPWTEEETKIIAQKIWLLVTKPHSVRFHFKRIYPNYEYVRQTEVNAKKVTQIKEAFLVLFFILTLNPVFSDKKLGCNQNLRSLLT